MKRCDGDSDASVRGVGEGATRYHAGGDGELRFVKMVFMDGLLPGSVGGPRQAHRSRLVLRICSFGEKPVLLSTSS